LRPETQAQQASETAGGASARHKTQLRKHLLQNVVQLRAAVQDTPHAQAGVHAHAHGQLHGRTALVPAADAHVHRRGGSATPPGAQAAECCDSDRVTRADRDQHNVAGEIRGRINACELLYVLHEGVHGVA